MKFPARIPGETRHFCCIAGVLLLFFETLSVDTIDLCGYNTFKSS
jgi:hypothetical protein